MATIAIYSVVFSVFIRLEPPPFGNGREGVYAVWLISGLVTWNFLNQTLTQGMPSLLGNGALLQKVHFPSFAPVMATGLMVAIQSLIELAVVLAVLLALLNVGVTWLLLPLWAGSLYLFANAVGYSLAVANVHWRDLGQISAVVLQLLFFLSPVVYPITIVPESIGPIPARTLVELNPLTQFTTVGRQLMYDLTLPTIGQSFYLVVLTLAMLWTSRWVHQQWGGDIGEAM